jgi:hypothetical protein
LILTDPRQGDENVFLTMHLKEFKYYLLSSVELLKGLSSIESFQTDKIVIQEMGEGWLSW